MSYAWMECTLLNDTLTKDIERFSDLHSWYKHAYGGITFHVAIFTGLQPAYNWQPTDPQEKGELHWYFMTKEVMSFLPNRMREISMKHTFTIDENFGSSERDGPQREAAIAACRAFWKELFGE